MNPHKSESRGGARQVAKRNTDTADSATSIATLQARDRSGVGRQIVALALAGHQVIRGDRNDYIVSKYGMAKYCRDFAELVAFARKLGVNHD